MANKLDPMDLQQIIRLKIAGNSNREIAKELSISRNTINNYVRLFKKTEHSLDALLELDIALFCALFPTHTAIENPRYNLLMNFFEKMNKARSKPGFTFSYHYEQYIKEHNNPYGYTQFMEHYNRKYATLKGSMKLEHIAGQQVYIDFAGKKLSFTDRETGEIIAVEVFVAILPCSHYTYVEACMSQKQADLIACMINTLSYYGGVPMAIVSDNLKSAVTRSCKYEPVINRSFKDLARHYNCVVNPTRAYSPQDKALVENAVKLAYQRIYHPMREMTFFSLSELNIQIRKLLEDYNNLLFQRKETSRKELFQSIEREFLKPLPATAFLLKDYKRAKVQKMGYVYLSADKNYYSVPYRHIGKHTQIAYSTTLVEVFFNHQRIAVHQRSKSQGTYITNEDHLLSTHKVYKQWSAQYFLDKAGKYGDAVYAFVEGLLNQSGYPEIAYKRINGVFALSRTYTAQRLNKACEMACYGQHYSYRQLKNILDNKMDMMELDADRLNQTVSHIPAHENIRGSQAYQ